MGEQQAEMNDVSTEINRLSLGETYNNEQEIFSFEKSCTFRAHQDMKKFLHSFNDRLNCIQMKQQNKDEVYNMCSDLIKNSFIFVNKLIEDENGMDTTFALNKSCEYIRGHLSKTNTTYKRNKVCEQDIKYVAPIRKALGTCWTLAPGLNSPTKYPKRIQNSMQYIPITDTIKSLFLRDDFRETYFEYNFEKKDAHNCQPGVFRDICCGGMLQNNELFREHPESLQIQIAYDDCVMTSALQSKATVFKITLVYFTIRNVPAKFLSKLDNIYLVGICFADDLKSQETDFNDIWRFIVRDIQYLQTFGVQVNDDVTIKGSLVSLVFDNLGAHIALGFAESFNTTFYCIHCEMPKHECQRATRPVASYKRTLSSYTQQLDIIASTSKVDLAVTKGIKRHCVLNDL